MTLEESIKSIEDAGLEINAMGIVVMPDEDYTDFMAWLAEDPTPNDPTFPSVAVMSQSEFDTLLNTNPQPNQ